MEGERGTLGRCAAALVLLCGVSLYRQLSLRLWPADPVRPAVVCAVYLLLLLGWLWSIRLRFTQGSLRRFLYGEIAVMAFWAAVRFLQDAWLVRRSLRLTRVSGYWIALPVLFIPLLGLFAAFGLGKGEDYRIRRGWYLLFLPAGLLFLLMVTNERHHLIFRVSAADDLHFHPGEGLWLVLLFPVALEVARVAVLCRTGRDLSRRTRSLRRYLPLAMALLMPLYSAPYIAASFVVAWEPVELSAGLFFLEAMVWESSVAAGLIPVNTRYEEVFRRSAAAMRIVAEDGALLARSGGTARPGAVTELHRFPIRGGVLLWEKDVSQLRAAIEALRQTGEALSQEGDLLREELRARSEEAKTQAQNRIYDQLTREVGPQLALMSRLLEADLPDRVRFARLCLVGTYVKRRCSLRLTGWQTGAVPGEDVAQSLADLVRCMERLGTEAGLTWDRRPLPLEGALLTLDTLEGLAEAGDFALTRVEVRREADGAVSLALWPDPGGPAAGERDGWSLRREALPGGCRLTLRERGGAL